MTLSLSLRISLEFVEVASSNSRSLPPLSVSLSPSVGMLDMVTQSFQALGDLFKPTRRRSSGANSLTSRTRQISI